VQPGSVHTNSGPLFTITPSHASQEPFTVNLDHILVLQITLEPAVRYDSSQHHWTVSCWAVNKPNNALVFTENSHFDTEIAAQTHCAQLSQASPLIWEVSMQNFLDLAPELQQQCRMYAPRALNFDNSYENCLIKQLSVEFGPELARNSEFLANSAWLLGFSWLSDEESSPIMQEKLNNWCNLLRNSGQSGDITYSGLSRLLSCVGLLPNAVIPRILINSSVEFRRFVAQGIISAAISPLTQANGAVSLYSTGFSALESAQFLVKSCGIPVKTIKTEQNGKFSLEIQLNSEELSLKPGRHSELGVNSWNFNVESCGIGNYYGFTVDLNSRFLLRDFTVTHNTTFIKYLVERDFPGAHIGPEPTTDRFVAVMHGSSERIIPGNALASDASKPFTALNKFGMAFLNKFEASQCDSKILEKLTFIDSPGILSGEKQRLGRSYNFAEIIEWFAERADRILLLFDAHKLDISDEFKTAIEALRGHDDKIKVILNKADIETQHLMRVYGALMWSLGKVIRTPEVPRVFIGSFWDGPLRHTEMAKLLKAEQDDLLADLRALPRNSTVRKINELVKRARMAKVHAHIINHLRNQFGMFGKDKTQKKLLEGLGEQFKQIQGLHNLPAGDFPNVNRFRDIVSKYELHKFPKLDTKMLKNMDDVLAFDIPNLMRILPGAEEKQKLAEIAAVRQLGVEGADNPFKLTEDTAPVNATWAISRAMKTRYDNEFYALDLTTDNKVQGKDAKKILLKSKLDPSLLKRIWDLADLDKDGMLDSDEFAVAMYLIDQMVAGDMTELPTTLPMEIIPPVRRRIEDQ
jgi:hypothetical protein